MPSITNLLIRRFGGSALITASAVLFGLLATASYGQAPSPVGPTWDCIISGGGERGIAFLTFADDGTFSGHELLVPRASTVATSGGSDGRNPGGGAGRGDNQGRVPGSTSITSSGGGTNSVTTATNLFGFEDIVGGFWTTNLDGRITGAFVRQTESGPQPVSFRGRVRRGSPRRLVLVANGSQTFSGIPQTYRSTRDISGTWDGFKFQLNPVPFPEKFTLTALGETNLYRMDSLNAGGYSYTDGRCMVSIQKKIGFVVMEENGTNQLLRATLGPFYKKRNPLWVKTQGVIDPDQQIVFKAQLESP